MRDCNRLSLPALAPLGCLLLLCQVAGCAPSTGKPRTVLRLAPKQTASVKAWAPDGKHLLVAVGDRPYGVHPGGWNASLTSIDLQTGAKQVVCKYRGLRPQYTPDGQRLLMMAPSVEARLVLRSIETGQEQLVYRPADKVEVVAAFLARGETQVVTEEWDLGHPDGFSTRLQVFDLSTGKRRVFASMEDLAAGLYCAPDGRHFVWLVDTPDGYTVRVGDLQSGKSSTLWTSPDSVFLTPQCWSPDTRRLVGFALPAEGEVKVLAIGFPDGAVTVLESFAYTDRAFAVHSPVGDEVAFTMVGWEDRRWLSAICIADATDGTLKRQFGPFDGRIESILWSPAGDLIAFSTEHAVQVLEAK